eukprot:NODE_76_length_2225_cov_329.505069.p1 GENE.NODE_76_length_2225_cov_329.505069~~NODE_76_length_2225_cov_329.505069.p1  ORF type:complete len:541 (+),score=115.35 NODE_76_length_2225_cov_329.505069:41-1624(+)
MLQRIAYYCAGLKSSSMYWACLSALLNTILTMMLKAVDEGYFSTGNGLLNDFLKDSAVYTAFSFLLGLVIVFRTSQAYGRFAEGCTLMSSLRTDMMDACSSLIAFSRATKAKEEEVREFRHMACALFSALHAIMVSELQGLDEEDLHTTGAYTYALLNIDTLGRDQLDTLLHSPMKAHLVFQWLQNLCVDAVDRGLLNVPPPIMTRAFQGLAGCMLRFQSALRFAQVPFPRPYLIVTNALLVIHWVVTPFVTGFWTYHMWVAGVASFVQVFVLWTLTMLAREMDNPFGCDLDDLNTKAMQQEVNSTLALLLDRSADICPRAAFRPRLEGPTYMSLAEAFKQTSCVATKHSDFEEVEVALPTQAFSDEPAMLDDQQCGVVVDGLEESALEPGYELFSLPRAPSHPGRPRHMLQPLPPLRTPPPETAGGVLSVPHAMAEEMLVRGASVPDEQAVVELAGLSSLPRAAAAVAGARTTGGEQDPLIVAPRMDTDTGVDVGGTAFAVRGAGVATGAAAGPSVNLAVERGFLI